MTFDGSGINFKEDSGRAETVVTRLNGALNGAVVGFARDANPVGNKESAEWGLDLAATARRLFALLGMEERPDALPSLTWDAARAAAVCFAPDASTEASANIDDLFDRVEFSLAGGREPLNPSTRRDPCEREAQLNRALFRIAPTLQLLAAAGDAVDDYYRPKARRGGSREGRARRWLMNALVEVFEGAFGRLPQVPTRGGREPDKSKRDAAFFLDTPWFQAVFRHVREKLKGQAGVGIPQLLKFSDLALDKGLREGGSELLRGWITEALVQKSKSRKPH